VMCSMAIWGTQISLTQCFGYTIALGGLLYYKLGADQLKQHISHLGRSWTEFGTTRPVARKLLVFGLVIFTVMLLLGGLAPTYAPTQTKALKDVIAGSHFVPGRK
jgi:hypothetical protein